MSFRRLTCGRHLIVPGAVLIALTSVLLALTVGVGQSSGDAAPTTTTTSTPSSTTVLSGTGYSGHPVGVPAGPVPTVADCPSDPTWSTPLPSGVTASPPSLGTANSGSVTVTTAGTSQSESSESRCEYTLSVPGTPDPNVTYTGGSSYYEAIDTEFAFNAVNAYGQECTTNAELGNFGVAFGKQELTSSSCNTDSSGIWGYAQITNGSYQNGTAVNEEPNLNQWYQSTIAGSAFYATFQICMQDPLNQHANYQCFYDYFGPF
jgi:hypothetical protein